MSSAPERPRTVPADAVFIAATDEWRLGSVDERGELHGPQRFFRADGTRSLECQYASGVLEGPFQRFHPNGELARRGIYRSGKIHGIVEAFASRDPTPEGLRSCCVPPGAIRLEADYHDGDQLGERFYNQRGERLVSDGSVYPPKPGHLPPEARFDESSRRWHAGGHTEHGEREGLCRLWSIDGTLLEETTFASGKRHGRSRTWRETGELCEDAQYENGRRSGPFRRILGPLSIYADRLIREERGTYALDHVTGIWEFLDDRQNVVCSADFGVPLEDVAGSPAFSGTPKSAEAWQRVARDLVQERRMGEALCAIAHAAAVSKDRDVLARALDEMRPALVPEAAAALAEMAMEAADGKLSMLVDGLLRGGDPAPLLHALASSSPNATRASLDFVDTALLFAPDREPCFVTRSLIQIFFLGDPEGAARDAGRLSSAYAEQSAFLLDYQRVLFPKFDFWPARAAFDSLLTEVPDEPCQPISKIRQAIQKCATRLQLIRRAIVERMQSTPRWQLPDVSGLLPDGPLKLERQSFEIALHDDEIELAAPGEQASTMEAVSLDETLDVADPAIGFLMRRARAEWNALTWLCWSAGLCSVALPDRIKPPKSFAAAVGMAIERQWRAKDRLATAGLLARTKGIRAFEWEGMDIDAMHTIFVEMAAEEYTDLRAVFFFLCDDRQQSPWQDNLRRD